MKLKGDESMNNKKTGRFIAQCRKEMNLSQKQLAEKLNVTDKAVSKWETGNGAPDISLLTSIAEALNITVIELLDGQHAEKENTREQTEKIVLEALNKAKKERKKTIKEFFIIFIILFSFVNIVVYGYRGNRHKILYDVETVYVHQDEENNNKYDFYYNCKVKNWWFDFNKHTYSLEAELMGEPGSWDFKAKTDSITSTNLYETYFVIHVEFDKTSIIGTKPTIEEAIMMGQFSAYKENGEYDERANLYMNDFTDAKIIIM